MFFRKKLDIGGFKIRNQTEIHFLSFAVVQWVDVFTRKEYRDILLNSLGFCQEAKGLGGTGGSKRPYQAQFFIPFL